MPDGITQDTGSPQYGATIVDGHGTTYGDGSRIVTADHIGTVLDNGNLTAWFNGTGSHYHYGNQTWIDGQDHVHLDTNEGSGYHACGKDIDTCSGRRIGLTTYATVEDAEVARIVDTATDNATRVGYWPPMVNRVPRGDYWNGT